MCSLHRVFDSPTLQNTRNIPSFSIGEKKEMKSRIVVVLFAITVLSMGCSGEGVFENPDSIEVTTLNAIQGKTGHLVNFTIGKDTTGTTKRAVLALRDQEVSPAALYIVLESGNADLHGLIDLLKNAADIAVVPDIPKNTEPLTRLWLNSGEGYQYAGFLRITAAIGTQYLSIRGTLSQERKNWYLRELTKPPTAIYTTPIIAIDEITFGDLNFYIHGDGTSSKPAKRKNNQQNQQDFIGCVYVPKVSREIHLTYRGETRSFSQPLPGVTVTIMSGKRSGESTITNQDGQYIFRDIREDKLHLLVEKEHFEPKEVIVHRSRQTVLANGNVPNYDEDDPQKIPGNILIGQVWPEPIRPLLQQVKISDPLFIIADLRKKSGGVYSSGVVVIDKNIYIPYYTTHIVNTFAHEIAHMRQHAIVSTDGSGNVHDWVHTPEGVAFAAARQKDWNEVGKAKIDHVPGFSSLLENAAEICAYYWTGENRTLYGNPKVTAPNRFKWAEEWLNKR